MKKLLNWRLQAFITLIPGLLKREKVLAVQ
jgi:hypothetical protein